MRTLARPCASVSTTIEVSPAEDDDVDIRSGGLAVVPFSTNENLIGTPTRSSPLSRRASAINGAASGASMVSATPPPEIRRTENGTGAGGGGGGGGGGTTGGGV